MAKLEILFQDEELIAVNKPAGFLVHPADCPEPDDQVVMKILRDQIGCKVDPVHRIDRPTSGVLLFSLNRGMTRELNLLMDRRELEKTYWALVEGSCQEAWTCLQPLRKNPEAPLLSAETKFRVLRTFQLKAKFFTLLECQPLTGRYHQIRKHLAGIHRPIVGDYRYAGIERSDQLGGLLESGTRMYLQAKSLRFKHPRLQREILIEAPVDPIFRCAGVEEAID